MPTYRDVGNQQEFTTTSPFVNNGIVTVQCTRALIHAFNLDVKDMNMELSNANGLIFSWRKSNLSGAMSML